MKSLKGRITLPSEWLTITAECLLITYFIDGKMRFIQIDRGEDAADLLLENGIITSYEGSGKSMKMYHVAAFIVGGKNGIKMEWYRTAVVEWEKIKLYPSDALHIAASHEYALAGAIMGLVPGKAKVRSIYNHITQAA